MLAQASACAPGFIPASFIITLTADILLWLASGSEYPDQHLSRA